MTILQNPLAFGSGDYVEPNAYQTPATCSFPNPATCAHSSPGLCTFSAPPPSACGVFDHPVLCENQWSAPAACAAFLANGICA